MRRARTTREAKEEPSTARRMDNGNIMCSGCRGEIHEQECAQSTQSIKQLQARVGRALAGGMALPLDSHTQGSRAACVLISK